jgi:hypothetical protein
VRAVWTVITLLLLINALLMAGAAGWLYRSGRLDQERIDRIREMLSITIQQEKEQEMQAQALEEQSRQQALEIARLESVSDGPITLADRLHSEQLGDELAVQRIERLRRDISDMRRQLRLAKDLLAKQHAELSTQREAFEQAVERQTKLKRDEDFQQTVQMYQKVKPKQAKGMFQELLSQGKAEQVVDYLSAMQLRKAAAVLKEFKKPDEIVQATDLLQRLRERGIEMDRDGNQRTQRPQETLSPPPTDETS